ncbi:MAG: OmpA family protein, partial [Pedobacter sp.]|nr:OmpA family protein [Pedobacter sp.]
LDVKNLTGYFEAEATARQTVLPIGFGAASTDAATVKPSNVAEALPESGGKEHHTTSVQHDDKRPSHTQDPTHLDDQQLHAAVIAGPINPIKGFTWVLPVLITSALILVLWFCTIGPGNNYVKPTMKENDTATPFLRERIQPGIHVGAIDENTGDFMYDNGDMTTIVLPNGQEFQAGENSTEVKLVAFLKEKNIEVDAKKGNWYEFTNVHFKLNSAELMKVSEAQLKNMAEISKAFPEAKFKFGGYTDNVGDAAINKPLSQKRAESVAKLVESLGGPANSFVSPEGYGAEHPIADNANATGRAMNRRVAVNVQVK